MTVNKAIRTALASYIEQGWSVVPDTANKLDEVRYITFNSYYTGGDDIGDDAPLADVDNVYIHLYLPEKENYFSYMKDIRKKLFEFGFSYPSVTMMTDPDRDGYRHLIFDCEWITESEV